MKLYFLQSNGKRRFLQDCVDEHEAWRAIHQFCEERNFHIYYSRSWTENGETWYDVGSHTEFFILI